MPVRSHLPVVAAAVIAVTVAAGAAPSSAPAGASPALTLTPASMTGTATPHRILGPFTLRNGTRAGYDVTVDAVLLTQLRSGAIVVRDDAAARRAAARLVSVQASRFTLPAGRARSVAAAVRAIPRRQGVYAGVLFAARPRASAAAGAQITNLLRLDAGQLLAPRARRPRFSVEPIRAEQAGRQRLRLAVGVENGGNVLGRVNGHVDVLDASGRRVLRARVEPTRILPGATVDVSAPLGGRLGPGRYRLGGRVVIDGRPRRVAGAMELFGVNTIRAEDAVLTALESPTAVAGRPLTLAATFRNTGNVPYAPVAVVDVRRLGADGAGETSRPVMTSRLDVGRAAPGKVGRISGRLRLPQGRAFQLTVRLLAGHRELDAQAVRVDVHDAPSLGARIAAFLRENALVLLAAGLALLLAGAACAIAYVARLKARLAAAPRRR